MLLDCGEGSYGQLRRRYGAAADGVIARLRCVWISHIHADHHAGLGRSAWPQLLALPCLSPVAASLPHSGLAPPAAHVRIQDRLGLVVCCPSDLRGLAACTAACSSHVRALQGTERRCCAQGAGGAHTAAGRGRRAAAGDRAAAAAPGAGSRAPPRAHDVLLRGVFLHHCLLAVTGDSTEHPSVLRPIRPHCTLQPAVWLSASVW